MVENQTEYYTETVKGDIRMRITMIIAILFIVVSLILSACTKSAAPDEKQPANEVRVPFREFRPSIITVPVGTTVTWVSKNGEEPHTITSSLFNGSLLAFGSFRYTFTERGRFEYYCQTHGFEGMTGVVIVE